MNTIKKYLFPNVPKTPVLYSAPKHKITILPSIKNVEKININYRELINSELSKIELNNNKIKKIAEIMITNAEKINKIKKIYPIDDKKVNLENYLRDLQMLNGSINDSIIKLCSEDDNSKIRKGGKKTKKTFKKKSYSKKSYSKSYKKQCKK